jgi:hypothetical protein
MRSVLALFACFTATAIAQAPAPSPESPQPAAPERPALRLKLDNPSSWATVKPDSEKQQPDGLPSLGDNVRPIPTTPAPTPARTSPYPSEPKAGY